jgi:hypothetical protein
LQRDRDGGIGLAANLREREAEVDDVRVIR